MRTGPAHIRGAFSAAAAVLLLAFASDASATHPIRQANKRALRHATYHPPLAVCDPRSPEPPTIKNIVNQTKAVGGPVAKRLRKSRLDHRSSIVRNVHRTHDDDQAIQNDTLIADASIDLAIALRPLGFFDEASELRPVTVTYSPRSPRGPPPAARHPFMAPDRLVKFEVTDAGSLSRPEV
jgi:hypothetical protein